MKATFLAPTVIPEYGRTTVTLVDAPGANDFKAGSRDGKIILAIFGEQSLFVPGKAYQVEITDPTAPVQEAAAPEATTPQNLTPEAIRFLNEAAADYFAGKAHPPHADEAFETEKTTTEPTETTSKTTESSAAPAPENH